MGYGHFVRGDRAAAGQAYREAIALSQASKDIFTGILATIGLGNLREAEIQLPAAAETYRRILHWVGDPPQQIIHELHLGLARVLREWNNLEAAEEHGRQGLHLARQYEQGIDRSVICELFLAELKLTQGDLAGAATLLAQAGQSVRQLVFAHRFSDVAAVKIRLLLRQGQVAEAAHLAEAHTLPLSLARVRLAQGDPAAALAVFAPLRHQAEARGWPDVRLRVLVLEALAQPALGAQGEALQCLGHALAAAEPWGFIRTFVDEGAPMAQLLSAAAAREISPAYASKLQAIIAAEARAAASHPLAPVDEAMVEPLSERELEVLRLIARGISNQEIGQRLFLALDTIKGHNRRLFDKLHVQRRTEAVARARELGLLWARSLARSSAHRIKLARVKPGWARAIGTDTAPARQQTTTRAG